MTVNAPEFRVSLKAHQGAREKKVSMPRPQALYTGRGKRGKAGTGTL